MKTYRGPIVLFAAVLLASCGGGAVAGSNPPLAAHGAGLARFTITVPQQRASTAARAPQYVSANTKSASISVNGGAATVVQLSSGTSNCTSGSGGLQCAISVTAPIGNDTFAISLYASSDGTGTPLATQSIGAAITANQTTPVSITLDGVVSALSLALSNAAPVQGSAADITLTVTAKDASGATIVGPGNFSFPIAISDDDTSGATTLSATQITSPSADTIAVHYTGAQVTAHFTASAPNAKSAVAALQSVAAPTPAPSPGAPTQLLWVANNGGQSVLAFDTAAILGGGSPAPATVLAGSNTGFSTYSPQCVQQDSLGNLYVVGSEGSKNPAEVMYFAGGNIGGNLTPNAIVAGGNTTLTNAVGCQFDSYGNLWLANDDNYNDSLVAFSSSQLASGGNVAPSIVISPITCCGNTSLCNTVGVAFDPSGDLWTGSLCAATVVFSAQDVLASGSPNPYGYIQPGGVNAVAFDSSGNLWRALGSSIDEYDASNLQFVPDVAPDRTISGTNTQIGNAVGLTFDDAGNLWVADNANSALLMYSKADIAAGGNIAPSAVIAGPASQLSGPLNIQFFNLPVIGVSTTRAPKHK